MTEVRNQLRERHNKVREQTVSWWTKSQHCLPSDSTRPL